MDRNGEAGIVEQLANGPAAGREVSRLHFDHFRELEVAFVDPARSLTYGELQAATCRFAGGLTALGLRQESRMLLLMLDTVDYPVAFWGAIRAGVVPIPLNTMLTAEQYAYIFADSRAEAVIVSAPLLKAVESVLENIGAKRMIVVAGLGADEPLTQGGPEKHRFEDVLARGRPDVWTADTSSDETAFWLYSSGSTGEPKGVRHIHTSLMATAHLYARDVLGIRADDVVEKGFKRLLDPLGDQMKVLVTV